MACTIIAGIEVCEVIGQYEEFVTIFHSGIGDNLMTLDQFNIVVQHIDEKFAKFLNLQRIDEIEGRAN
jgi:hypothetical protein